ncbi:MarR family transcriptional regulator [Glycomyces algeriensis]|uniref:MarR family transcriptional regulator n=1 Tax=Glycomyces algeriensis TaxID=256037 RepID=A0A9W6LJB4_9ACTN|nr:MarR family transcriptional regulator [Glycomyces algeriensis]MDA1368366.1 MarR family transcriptional regulator [Glycomyces algeriensis]MDR7351809.1 DNA-binding MarR family transcriptional regulator [Glycomyces algeriensis]GLI44536.1 MarR family transcriptional regulator [Glycomyces algeriensis]
MHDRLANLLGATALNVVDLVAEEQRSASDLGDSASAALLTLDEFPGLAVTTLGRYIGLSQPAAARMVDGLVQRGLVERRTGQGRAVAVHLTAPGKRTVARLLKDRKGVLGPLVEGLDAKERVALEALLEKLLHAVYASTGRAERVPDDALGELLCRLCDRAACIREGAACPVTQAGKCAATGTALEGSRHA